MLGLTLFLTSLLAAPQDFPKPDADSAGIVLDEQDKPVAGARVELRFDLERSEPWSQAIAQVLKRTPLPGMTTREDGTFVLPLARDQRLLGTCGEGSFALVVAKPGFQRWCEPLPNGLAGWLGSRVVLQALGAEDLVTVTVERPEPGMRMQIRRIDAADPDPGEDVAVPDDGVVRVRLPLVPSPRPPVEAFRCVRLGLQARLWNGPAATAWRPLDPAGANPWPRAEQAASSQPADRRPLPDRSTTFRAITVRVRKPDGAPLANALVLASDAPPATVPPAPARHTDERGEATLPDVCISRGPGLIRVLSDDFLCRGHELDPNLDPVRGADLVAEPSRCLSLQSIRVTQADVAAAPRVHDIAVLTIDLGAPTSRAHASQPGTRR